ncbi:MAG: flagellar hook-basal body complex protein [Lachnospiraceae bacterium]|nr:flagellar hook-basal body complex protein [Lachnospiraceae bacterium]
MVGSVEKGNTTNASVTSDKKWPTEYTVIDASGTSKASTDVPIYLSYLTDTSGKEIENSRVYRDAEGKLYAYKELETDDGGQVTKGVFISLGCASSTATEVENLDITSEVAKWKTYYRDYFANNYSGVDSDIYVDGNSVIDDKTSYTSTITINGHAYKTIDGYHFERDNNQYKVVKNEDGSTAVSYPLDANNLKIALKSEYFTKTVTDDTVDSDVDSVTDLENLSIVPSSFDTISLTGTSYYSTLKYNTDDGTFVSIGNAKTASLALSNIGGNFENVDIDFTQTTNYYNGGSSTLALDRGALDGTTDAGKKLGAMIGVSINNSGMIFGSYDNGNTVLLGQIAVAEFANASGLEKVGENCYQTTLNSGEFDGIGVDITANGGSMTTGALEMSNVDLSNEFTDMITTQRGFQANSRIITTSDTLLEELINLKR